MLELNQVLTNPLQPFGPGLLRTFPCNTGFGMIGLSKWKLIAYQGVNLPSTNPSGAPDPVFINFCNENTCEIYGNVPCRGYPLFFTADSNQANLPGKGIDFSGRNRYNDARQLQIEVTDRLNNPIAFTRLTLVWDVELFVDPRDADFSSQDMTTI